MSTTTSNLELFKYTESDYEDDFNLQIALNENWDKIDQLYDIISLENSGTLNLTNNRVHKVSNASDTITFILIYIQSLVSHTDYTSYSSIYLLKFQHYLFLV